MNNPYLVALSEIHHRLRFHLSRLTDITERLSADMREHHSRATLTRDLFLADRFLTQYCYDHARFMTILTIHTSLTDPSLPHSEYSFQTVLAECDTTYHSFRKFVDLLERHVA